MCGITGIVHPRAGGEEAPNLEPYDIVAMTDSLTHRGPDASGYFQEPGIAFGHRRLKVIDLEGGVQPMRSLDRNFCLVFNGEIYNYRELREELKSAGYIFRTSSDTEVLLNGFAHWGTDVLPRLNGMFAFAIWDARQQRLVLARDPMGQKPLFYAQLADRSIIFGSEAKALVAHSALKKKISEEALAAYLTYEYLPADLCIYEGVKKLEPSQCLQYIQGQIETEMYWDMPFREPVPSQHNVQDFLRMFDDAVQRHLVADVPVGVFLSGGIDSSSVAASLVAHRGREAVKTFSIAFEDKTYDESSIARQVAHHLGTEHSEKMFTEKDMLDVLPKVTSILDEPFGDASILPTFLLSSFARESVTVALGGDGGDELLLGYPTFYADLAARVYAGLPRFFRMLLSAGARALPVSTANFSLDFVATSFVKSADLPTPDRHALWLGSVVPESADDPYSTSLRRKYDRDWALSFARNIYNRAPGSDYYQKLSYLYSRSYLPDDILHKVDRASMAVSLEVRAPFLDTELVSMIAGLPRNAKLRFPNRGKVILKQAQLARLPAAVISRKKKGFGVPMAAWLRGELQPLMRDMLHPERIRAAGYFRPEVVTRLVDEHSRGQRNHRKVLWTMLNFELWREARGIQVSS